MVACIPKGIPEASCVLLIQVAVFFSFGGVLNQDADREQSKGIKERPLRMVCQAKLSGNSTAIRENADSTVLMSPGANRLDEACLRIIHKKGTALCSMTFPAKGLRRKSRS